MTFKPVKMEQTIVRERHRRIGKPVGGMFGLAAVAYIERCEIAVEALDVDCPYS